MKSELEKRLMHICTTVETDEELSERVAKALRDNGYVKLPAGWYIEPDGDGDPSIWRPHPFHADKSHQCIGIRMMAGNAKIEKPVADWLWANIRKVESEPIHDERGEWQ
jgi:hypothetical protein